MITINIYDHNDDGDKRSLTLATNAAEMGLALWDIKQFFRNKLKLETLSKSEMKTLEETQAVIYKIIHEYHQIPESVFE